MNYENKYNILYLIRVFTVAFNLKNEIIIFNFKIKYDPQYFAIVLNNF